MFTVLLETTGMSYLLCVTLYTPLSLWTHTQPTGSVCSRHWNRSIRICLTLHISHVFIYTFKWRPENMCTYLNDFSETTCLTAFLISASNDNVNTFMVQHVYTLIHFKFISYTSYILSFHQCFGSSFSNVRMCCFSVRYPRLLLKETSFKQNNHYFWFFSAFNARGKWRG